MSGLNELNLQVLRQSDNLLATISVNIELMQGLQKHIREKRKELLLECAQQQRN